MLFRTLCRAALLSLTALQVAGLAISGKPNLMIKPYKREVLQDIVTWDEHSIFINGDRVMLYSAEFHPFRLPVPSLWLDVFQKIKSMGYNTVSVYFDWALVEGKPGNYTAEGIFALEPFFEAAKTAGIYILARPGPYINAEVSGGGFPGWLQRTPGRLRTTDKGYIDATENYIANIGKSIAAAQITNGGPVILVQPENEYSGAAKNVPEFPDPVYWSKVEDQLRKSGIVVPFISNDNHNHGYFAPGPPPQNPAVSVDIYGHDGYPLGFDCANPETWPDNHLPTNFGEQHLNQSSSTPFSLVEFQGGSFDPWGGPGFTKCGQLLGPEFQRVFYKNDFSFGVTFFSIYMTYGGTNWGNLGHPGGYTSYDYGAVISEERLVGQEKYSQAKLLANFLQASPAYLTAAYQNNTYANGSYTGNSAIATTALFGEVTKFFVVRHAFFNTLESTDYTITLPTSQGNITIPQLGGSLTLHGRDSKVYATDYDVGGANLLYTTAEIFTWKQYGDTKVLILYGGPDETNEFAVSGCGGAKIAEGEDVKIEAKNEAIVVQYSSSSTRKVVEFDNGLWVYLLDRQSAYNYWVVDLPNDDVTANFTNHKHAISAPIIQFGYLVRTVKVDGNNLHLTGDLNATSSLEVIGAPHCLEQLTFNGESLDFEEGDSGIVTATVVYNEPALAVPDLAKVQWKVVDSLPEIKADYDDSAWTSADLTQTPNDYRNLTTPTSLYSSDYGYHTGSLIYRGHFTANGQESSLYLATQGGSAFGHSIWLDDTLVGSFYGADLYMTWNETYTLPPTTSGKAYVLTILVDNMGLDENYNTGENQMKAPRGILDYNLSGHSKSDIIWKLTGNLGREDYLDAARGPLNEGGLYAERQGYHLPNAPTSSWRDSAGPMEGIANAGVAFYTTTFDLDMPSGYDIPLSFSFSNATDGVQDAVPTDGQISKYRCQIYVNGYQFGKYVHNIGPQDVFPVPEGIWNYHGSNYVAVSLWALEASGAKVANLSLVTGPVIQSGFGPVELSPVPAWEQREGAY
ncbi:unnamed protein product [Zymoseptoria tritici ST99CH_1E4]|uniref:Beta-galactosidase n=1 Tax=Zymoseptoria tritici ST99CH_1E4 TaxID=1276532 RepID=A0A2H1GZ18_ZYMTR|nr:unnamed protein product [Zymoseptoria tritici ST99CH_1E4]